MPNSSKNQKLRKPKLGRAVRAPRKVRAPRTTGGTTAPAGAAKSHSTGINANKNLERAGVGPARRVPPKKPPPGAGSGEPAGAPPDVTPQAIPESARTANQRAEALSRYGLTEADLKQQLYMAALAYGDPSVIGQYGDAVPTPGGALQMIEKEGGEARKANTLARGQNNTFFSGMNLEDIRHIGDTESLKKQQAKDEWEKSLWELTVALQEAREAREAEENEADISDLEAFEATEPEPQGTAVGSGGKKGKKGKKPKIGIGPGKPAPAPKQGKKGKK